METKKPFSEYGIINKKMNFWEIQRQQKEADFCFKYSSEESLYIHEVPGKRSMLLKTSRGAKPLPKKKNKA